MLKSIELQVFVAKIKVMDNQTETFFDSKVEKDNHITYFNNKISERTQKSCLSVFLTEYLYKGPIGFAYIGSASIIF